MDRRDVHQLPGEKGMQCDTGWVTLTVFMSDFKN